MAKYKDLKDKFIEEFEKSGGFVSPTCQKLGIKRQTYYNWEQKDPEFKEKCEAIIELKTDQVKKSIFAAATEDRHFPSAKYIIETRYYRQRESELTTKLELNSSVNTDMDIEILERALNKAKAKKANENAI